MKNLVTIALFVLLLVPPTTNAQVAYSTDDLQPIISTTGLTCDDHVGSRGISVDADLPVDKVFSAFAGEAVTVPVTLTNNLPHPVDQVSVFAQVIQLPDSDVPGLHENARTEGLRFVRDQFLIGNNISIAPGAAASVDHTYQVPKDFPTGTYVVGYHVLMSGEDVSFNAYQQFDEAVTVEIANTSVTTGSALTLDPTSVRLNGVVYDPRDDLQVYSMNEPVTVTAELVNPSAEERTIPVEWTQHIPTDIEDGIAGNNLAQGRLVTVPANGSVTVTYGVVPQEYPVVQASLAAQDEVISSIVNIQLLQALPPAVRLTMPALHGPVVADTEVVMGVCAEVVNTQVIDDVVMTMTLRDSGDSVVHEYTYKGSLTGVPSFFGEAFTPNRNHNTLQLTATLADSKGVVLDEVVAHYECGDWSADGECTSGNAMLPNIIPTGDSDFGQLVLIVILIVVAVIIVIIGFVLVRRKLRQGDDTFEEDLLDEEESSKSI